MGRKARKITVLIYAKDELIARYLKNFLSTDPCIIPILILEPTETKNPPEAVVIERDLLSKAEQKFLIALIQHGSINKVAAALNYSPLTVKTYMSRIYKKLKVKKACQAIALAIKYRLIEIDQITATLDYEVKVRSG